MDFIQPTPRNYLMGLLADKLQGGLDFATSNGKNKPMNMLAELLGVQAIQKTADRISYGEPLTTGRGYTTQMKPETFDAAVSVLPFAKPISKGAGLLAEGLRGLEGSKAVQSLSKASPMADRGAIVWHGSPHKFPPTANNPLGEFDFTKIGTGEGAQAYGHGGYLGGARETAEGYRNALTGNHNLDQFNPTVNGEIVNSPVVKNLIRNGHTPEQFISSMQKKLDSQLVDLSKASKTDELGLGLSDYDLAMIGVNDTKKMIDEASGYIGKNIKNEPLGYLYKVDLPDEHIAKMLDWDKPLSQQSDFAKNALEKSGMTKYSDEYFQINKKQNPTVADLHDFLKASGYSQNSIAPSFSEQGITGIKYLDGGSRAAGSGSSNYVVFPGNERLLKILERNGESVTPKFDYPQSEALKLAQQRAALPISENGLGLPANNTAMDRANVMFPEKGYHGTNADIHAFEPLLSDTRRKTGTPNGAIVSSTNPKTASTYAGEVTDDYGNISKYNDGGNVIPLKVNTGNGLSISAKGSNWSDIFSPKYPDAETTNDIAQIALDKGKQSATIKKVLDNATWSKQNGVDSRIGDTIFSFNPDDIRSQFAAFDPWRRNAAIAASMGVAAPDLLANPLDGNNNRLIEILKRNGQKP